MELISPWPLTGEHELKQELFLRAEELERLVAIYKNKLCGDENNSLNFVSEQLVENKFAGVLEEQRGQFYDIYMKKREVKLMKEWQARGAKKEAEMRAMMESLASTSRMMCKGKVSDPINEHPRQINSRKFSSNSTVLSSTSQSSTTSALNPTTKSTNLPSLRKENTRPSKGSFKETNLQRSKSSSDRMGLVKDIRTSRSHSLRKNSASLGEPKDFMLINLHPRSGAPKPLIRKFSEVRRTCDFNSSVNSPCFDPGMGDQEGETVRVRKRWGTVERPVNPSFQSTVDVTKVIKRFLKTM